MQYGYIPLSSVTIKMYIQYNITEYKVTHKVDWTQALVLIKDLMNALAVAEQQKLQNKWNRLSLTGYLQVPIDFNDLI